MRQRAKKGVVGEAKSEWEKKSSEEKERGQKCDEKMGVVKSICRQRRVFMVPDPCRIKSRFVSLFRSRAYENGLARLLPHGSDCTPLESNFEKETFLPFSIFALPNYPMSSSDEKKRDGPKAAPLH